MSVEDLTWDLCRSLLAILREGSLSGAARALSVTHPTLRRHLDAAEAALGSPLFFRSPAGLTPTERALELRAPAEAMEAAFDHLVRTSSGPAATVAGSVRITASEMIGVEVLPSILAGLKARYSGLSIELQVTDYVEDVLRRDADIAVRLVRPSQPDLIARKVATIPLGLYAGQAWIAAHGDPDNIGALIASGALIGYDRAPAFLHWLAARGITAVKTDFGFRSDSTLAQFAAMRVGLGVAICQDPLARRAPNVRRVLPEFSEVLDIWLISHPALRQVARVRVTLDHLADGLAAYAAS